MQDQTEAEHPPLPSRNQSVEVGLDADRVHFGGQPEPPGQPPDVRVDRKTGQPEADASDDVGCLPANAWQCDEVLAAARNLPIERPDDTLRHPDQIACLGPEKPRGMDDRFDIGRCGVGQRDRIGIPLEQGRSHAIDPFVRALGGEDRGHEQLEHIPVPERAQLRHTSRKRSRQSLVDGSRPAPRRSWTGHGPETTGHITSVTSQLRNVTAVASRR